MKPYPIVTIPFSLCLLCAIILQCTDKGILEDTQQLSALRNVIVTCDSMTYEFGLPQGALGGKSFDTLVTQDSALFANPANYTITILINMTADNTKPDAQDAKFDGMRINLVMDTIVSSPLQTIVDSFEVKKGLKKTVQSHGTVNLATHRLPCLYIFRQTVDGNDLAATLSPVLNYKIGSQAGTIDLPAIKQNIPTRASPETKAFLAGLLNSGIFNNK